MTYFLLRLAIVLSLFAFAEWALAIERNPGFAFGYQLTGGPSVTNGEAGAGTVASGSADLLIGGKLRNNWKITGILGTQTYHTLPDSRFENIAGADWEADGFSMLVRAGKTIGRTNFWIEGGAASVEAVTTSGEEYIRSDSMAATYSVVGVGASYEIISREAYSFEFTASLRHMSDKNYDGGVSPIGQEMLVQNYGLAMNFYPQPDSFSGRYGALHIHCYVGCFDLPTKLIFDAARILPAIGAEVTKAIFRAH